MDGPRLSRWEPRAVFFSKSFDAEPDPTPVPRAAHGLSFSFRKSGYSAAKAAAGTQLLGGEMSEHVRRPRETLLLLVLAACRLAACGGNSGPIAVNGTVLDAQGQPMPGQTVLIASGSFQQSVVTDDGGAFGVANVPLPYDATLVDTDSQSVVQYQGLTRGDPTLNGLSVLPLLRTAAIAGNISGGNPLDTLGDTTLALFSTAQADLNFGSSSDSYTLAFGWWGPARITGTLYMLQVHTDGGPAGLPLDYPGYGTLSNISVQDQATLSGEDLTLQPVTTGVLSGTMSFPAGYDTAAFFSLQVAPGVSMPVVTSTDYLAASFSFTTPSLPDTSLVVDAYGIGTSGQYIIVQKTGLAANASGLVFSGTAGPEPESPPDQTPDVTLSTPFSWSDAGSAVHILSVSPPGPAPSGTVYRVYTTATTTTLPDVSSAGISLPAGFPYTWQVISLGGLASVDEAATPAINNHFAGDFNDTYSVSRNFNFAGNP